MANAKAACESDTVRRDSIGSDSVKSGSERSESDISDSDNQKLDLNVQNSEGNTPIHQIVNESYKNKTLEQIQTLEEYEIQIIKLMLKFNPDLNIKNLKGYTFRHLAIMNKRSDALVKVLLNYGENCDYNSTDNNGFTALYHAVLPISLKFSGNSSKFSNFNFTFRDDSIIKQLIENGANIRTAAKNGYSPLLLAVVMQKTDYVRVMLEKEENYSGVGLEQTSDTFCYRASNIQGTFKYPPKEYHGMTPLLAAVYDDNKEMAQLLVKAGADVNAVNAKNNGAGYTKTPLLISVFNCNLEMTKILVSAGADVNAVKEDGDNALHMIIKRDVKRWNATKEEHKEIAKLLIDGGIDLNAQDKSGETFLHIALLPSIRDDRQDIVTHILEKELDTL